MYLRTTQRRNKDGSVVRYDALAANLRDPEKGHVEAKVGHGFGRADRLDRATLERLVRSIRRVLDADGDTVPADATGRDRAIAIEASFELGIVHVVEQLWTRLGIGQAIVDRLAAEERHAPHEAALLAMTAQRLARPGSKLACHERWLERVWLPAARDLSLDQLYRALDVLAEHGDAIEEAVLWLCCGVAGSPQPRKASICSSSTSTWFSTTPPPPGSTVTRRTVRRRAGAA